MGPKVQHHISQEQGPHREQAIQEVKRRIACGERPWEEATGITNALEAARDVRFIGSASEAVGHVGARDGPLQPWPED